MMACFLENTKQLQVNNEDGLPAKTFFEPALMCAMFSQLLGWVIYIRISYACVYMCLHVCNYKTDTTSIRFFRFFSHLESQSDRKIFRFWCQTFAKSLNPFLGREPTSDQFSCATCVCICLRIHVCDSTYLSLFLHLCLSLSFSLAR